MPVLNEYDGLFGLSGDTLKGIGGAAEGVFGAVGDIMGGIARSDALQFQAQLYGEEANYLTLGQGEQVNTDFLKYMAEQRRAGMEIGAGENAAATSGRNFSGNVLDLLRESAQQGAFEQGQMSVAATANYMNFQGQIDAANMEAEAASKASQSAMMGGIFGAVGSLAKGAFALAPLL